jgi:LysR family transcriptional regulator, carnitine catabolism transcriptional activator
MITFTRQFNAFLTVARLGNFTRAAAKLAISQSTLTVQIRNLEQTLGVRLFDRNRRQVSLTTAGRELIAPIDDIVERIDSLVARTQDVSALRRGVVTIAALPSIASSVLPPVVASFMAANPGIKVRIHDVVAQRIVELVKAGDVDFGIGSLTRKDREVIAEPLWTDELCVFVNRQHPLATRRSVRLTDLRHFPLILTTRDSSVRQLFEKAADRARTVFSPVFEAHYMLTALALARAGLGAAVLPDSAIEPLHDSQLLAVPIRRPAVARKIVLVVKAGRSLPKAAELVVERLRSEGSR